MLQLWAEPPYCLFYCLYYFYCHWSCLQSILRILLFCTYWSQINLFGLQQLTPMYCLMGTTTRFPQFIPHTLNVNSRSVIIFYWGMEVDVRFSSIISDSWLGYLTLRVVLRGSTLACVVSLTQLSQSLSRVQCCVPLSRGWCGSLPWTSDFMTSSC